MPKVQSLARVAGERGERLVSGTTLKSLVAAVQLRIRLFDERDPELAACCVRKGGHTHLADAAHLAARHARQAVIDKHRLPLAVTAQAHLVCTPVVLLLRG